MLLKKMDFEVVHDNSFLFYPDSFKSMCDFSKVIYYNEGMEDNREAVTEFYGIKKVDENYVGISMQIIHYEWNIEVQKVAEIEEMKTSYCKEEHFGDFKNKIQKCY